jgi:hypothetical protein
MTFHTDLTVSADLVRRQRDVLGQHRRVSEAAGLIHEQAAARAKKVLARACALDRRLARLSTGTQEPIGEANRQRKALSLLSQLDQADAAANEILMTDSGPRLDALAELISKVVEDAHKEILEVIEY